MHTPTPRAHTHLHYTCRQAGTSLTNSTLPFSYLIHICLWCANKPSTVSFSVPAFMLSLLPLFTMSYPPSPLFTYLYSVSLVL